MSPTHTDLVNAPRVSDAWMLENGGPIKVVMTPSNIEQYTTLEVIEETVAASLRDSGVLLAGDERAGTLCVVSVFIRSAEYSHGNGFGRDSGTLSHVDVKVTLNRVGYVRRHGSFAPVITSFSMARESPFIIGPIDGSDIREVVARVTNDLVTSARNKVTPIADDGAWKHTLERDADSRPAYVSFLRAQALPMDIWPAPLDGIAPVRLNDNYHFYSQLIVGLDRFVKPEWVRSAFTSSMSIADLNIDWDRTAPEANMPRLWHEVFVDYSQESDDWFALTQRFDLFEPDTVFEVGGQLVRNNASAFTFQTAKIMQNTDLAPQIREAIVEGTNLAQDWIMQMSTK